MKLYFTTLEDGDWDTQINEICLFPEPLFDKGENIYVIDLDKQIFSVSNNDFNDNREQYLWNGKLYISDEDDFVIEVIEANRGTIIKRKPTKKERNYYYE